MDIINRSGYYYLHHTYKEDGTVKTKDLYIGKSIPKDIEKIKSDFLRQINSKTIFRKFDQIKANHQKNWEKMPASIKEKMIEEQSIEFTYNTNAIEGSTLTLDDTRKLLHDGISPNKPLRDVQESINHAKIFKNMVSDKYDLLSVDLIKEWHLEVFKESKPDMAGKFREYLVKVGNYLCPDWQDVPKLMDDFIDWYNEESKSLHPVELAAKAHYRFVKIHPFGDGNGRITRLIMNFILHKHGFPILIIEYKKRSSYYHALNQADKKTEYEFLKYIYKRYMKENKMYLK